MARGVWSMADRRRVEPVTGDVSVSIHSFSVFPERASRMNERFARVGLSVNWEADLLAADDPRNPEKSVPFAVMKAHLDAIRSFFRTGCAYGVVCEDDVLIRRSFREDLQHAIAGFESLRLDVLLLGYLLSFNPVTIEGGHRLVFPPFVFLSYGEELWGSQMYLVSRASARAILEAFDDATKVTGPYSPDWTITKYGKRACIFPMLAVEEGDSPGGSEPHVRYHRMCRLAQFDPDVHI